MKAGTSCYFVDSVDGGRDAREELIALVWGGGSCEGVA